VADKQKPTDKTLQIASDMHAQHAAREETYSRNADIIKAMQWLSVLDLKTCISCASLDLLQFPLDSGPRPPRCAKCRCTMVPVVNVEFAYLYAGATRSSKGAEGGAQVDATLSYYDWLKKLQPPEFQDRAIGPERAKLLRDGGLSARRFAFLMVDKNYAPISLDAMRAIAPIAFKRARL
jgi:hypothetical protein